MTTTTRRVCSPSCGASNASFGAVYRDLAELATPTTNNNRGGALASGPSRPYQQPSPPQQPFLDATVFTDPQTNHSFTCRGGAALSPANHEHSRRRRSPSPLPTTTTDRAAAEAVGASAVPGNGHQEYSRPNEGTITPTRIETTNQNNHEGANEDVIGCSHAIRLPRLAPLEVTSQSSPYRTAAAATATTAADVFSANLSSADLHSCESAAISPHHVGSIVFALSSGTIGDADGVGAGPGPLRLDCATLNSPLSVATLPEHGCENLLSSPPHSFSVACNPLFSPLSSAAAPSAAAAATTRLIVAHRRRANGNGFQPALLTSKQAKVLVRVLLAQLRRVQDWIWLCAQTELQQGGRLHRECLEWAVQELYQQETDVTTALLYGLERTVKEYQHMWV